MSRHGKGRSEREVNRSPQQFLCIYSSTIKAEKCLSLISNWLSTLGKEARRAKSAPRGDV